MKHFTMQEFTRSDKAQELGYANEPTPEHRANIEEFVRNLLDPLREGWAIRCAHEHYGTPAIYVSSGYRCVALNSAIAGSSQTSAHCVGYAADIVPMNGHLREFKNFCREWLVGRKFDQLISESENNANIPKWIHIGYKNREGKQRKQMLSAKGKNYMPITR
ncbi:MAG: peptidase M15A [Alistipes sp.]|nr:peptidase M15A [Alistipes sp.]